VPNSQDRLHAPVIPEREDGALLWVPADADPTALQKRGWVVLSFREIRDRYIAPARSRGSARTTLDNPAHPLLELITQTRALAIVGVSLRTAADLRDLYGFVVEPAYRRGATLLVAADTALDALDANLFVDPIGYPWTLERLRHVAARFHLGPAPDGMPPLTPIEAILFRAMRERGLAPIAQYGIGRYRADFAFPDVRLVVECDGRPWHDPDRDRERDAALRRKGWEPLHFTGSEISRDAAACAARVEREILRRRAAAESEQPDIAIPIRLSWWARLIEWFRGHFRRAPSDTAHARAQAVLGAPVNRPQRPWTSDLDPEQMAAVLSHDGIVQVIAPAGSGKTTVLASRVRELVARGVPPNRILCCTFNSAAAEELQIRLDQAGVEGVKATTFHAAGRAVLKRAGSLRSEVGTITYAQWRRLAKQAMDSTVDGTWIEAPDARDQISNLKLGQMVTVDEYAAIASAPGERTLAELYRLYEAALAEQNRNDFDDYIFGAVRLLQRDAEARRNWQGEYTAVLVDEYQDIEPAQELLVQLLAAPEDLLLCVGDEDQCLYAWRRASVERVIELDQLYPGLERHALGRNYRCPSLVVEASRNLIGRNRRRFPKQILTVRPEPGEIVLTAATDLAAQAGHCARLVKDLGQGEAVILARTARVLSEIALGLAQAGIRFFGPERIKRQSGEPAVMLAYLRLLGAPTSARPEDVDTVFRVPNRYLPDDAEINLASGLRSGLSFSEAIGRLRISETWRRDRLAEAGELFDSLSVITDASELIHSLRTDGGLDRHYADAEQLNPTDRSAVDTLAHAEETAAGMSVIEYADALDYQANIIEQHFDKKGIELATIHGAKGRQWSLVIVAGFEEDELPHARSLADAADPDGELEGERRLAYVALTRASQRLVLLHSADRPSRFLAEAALQVSAVPMREAAELTEVSAASDGRELPADAPLATNRQSAVRGWANRSIRDVGPQPSRPPVIRTSSASRVDGSISCSLPGCSGVVTAPFVVHTPDGLVGLCPRFEVHEGLAHTDPRLEAIWIDLKRLSDEARRTWRISTLGDDGGVPCSLPGCGGIVNPEYLSDRDGELVGLCAQRPLHEALARRDEATRTAYERLLAEQRAARLDGGRADDRRTRLLAEGGVPCAIPGCDGVVGAAYVIDGDEGPTGICGIAAAHRRLIATNPQAGAAFESIQRLRETQDARWLEASEGDDEISEGLPF
jgi:DNA helicase-2/ATP-dependent DNA helicase PcrA